MLQLIYDYIIRFYQSVFALIFNLNFFETKKLIVNKQFTEAHIFGSGASIITSKVLAQENAFKMACNLTVALLPQWELVLVEKLGISDYGNKQFSILKERKINTIVLKNIYPWDFNIEPRLIAKLKSVFLLRECQLQQRDNLQHVVDKLLMSRDSYYQYGSSILTMIMIAKNLGFKKIVLHGLDFNQSSFMDNTEFNYLTPKQKKNKTSARHATEAFDLPVSEVLQRLIDSLKEQDIHVFFAKELLSEF